MASKTFTTIETMTNARSALAWVQEKGVADPLGRVVGIIASPEKAVEWGIDETRILPFPETVGGRYSLWSAIGFPIALALGWPDFDGQEHPGGRYPHGLALQRLLRLLDLAIASIGKWDGCPGARGAANQSHATESS